MCHEEEEDNEKAKKVVFSLENQSGATTVRLVSQLLQHDNNSFLIKFTWVVVFHLNDYALSFSRYGGLSLRESVRENVTNPPKGTNKTQHSPPGFANKKDSG